MIKFDTRTRSPREVETINNINDINDTIDINDINDMANFFRNQKSANFVAASLPLGDRTSSEDTDSGSGQEAKGVKEIAKPKTLAEEKQDLQTQGLWIGPADIDYLKVSLWFSEPNDPHSLKLKYSFKQVNQNNLAYNNFSVALTRNRFDYIGNVKTKWADYRQVCPTYDEVYGYMKESNLLIYAGKAQRTRTFNRGGIQKIPMEPLATSYVFVDDAGDYYIRIRHHDFVCELVTPAHLWAEARRKWINEWAIKLECPKKDRPKNVPPFYTQTWRI